MLLSNKIQDDLRLNLYSNIDLKNKPNTREILQILDRFFFDSFFFLLLDRCSNW